ncbi:MAG: FKBP-type peptidyl-prolyl cis-trans isomerase [Pseudomonadales bacterium]
MKVSRSAAALAVISICLVGCEQSQQGLPRASEIPESGLQKKSYALGQSMASSLVASKLEIDPAYFNAGFYDAIDGVQRMTQEDIQATLMSAQQEAQQSQIAERTKMMESNQKAATEFLAQNAKAEGVVITDSGLQYTVLAEGEGASPTAQDTVTVHYEGRLIDGTVFDSSIERGEPATFPVNGVIAGWTEALQLMKVGSKLQLTIPPELGYGERGAGARIEPNSALVFDVELLGIEPAAEAADAGQ